MGALYGSWLQAEARSRTRVAYGALEVPRSVLPRPISVFVRRGGAAGSALIQLAATERSLRSGRAFGTRPSQA